MNPVHASLVRRHPRDSAFLFFRPSLPSCGMDDRLHTALNTLPHGAQFRFLDRLIEWNPGQSARAEYRVPNRAEFLDGHFPGDPIMPGVLMIEAIAQLAGVAAQPGAGQSLGALRLTAIRAAKIFGTAKPGEGLTISAEITGELGRLIQARGEVRLNDSVLVEAQVTLAKMDASPSP